MHLVTAAPETVKKLRTLTCQLLHLTTTAGSSYRMIHPGSQCGTHQNKANHYATPCWWHVKYTAVRNPTHTYLKCKDRQRYNSVPPDRPQREERRKGTATIGVSKNYTNKAQKQIEKWNPYQIEKTLSHHPSAIGKTQVRFSWTAGDTRHKSSEQFLTYIPLGAPCTWKRRQIR